MSERWCSVAWEQPYYLVRFGAQESADFFAIKDAFKDAFPHRKVVPFIAETKEWRVPHAQGALLIDWLVAEFDESEVEWDGPSPNDTTWQRTNDAPPPPVRREPAAYDAATAVLYVRPDAPWAVIQAAYRVLARQHHPDAGGDEVSMRRLNAAYEFLSQTNTEKRQRAE